MKVFTRFKVLPFFLVVAYLLAACGGTFPRSTNSTEGSKLEPNVVAFTGIVQSMTGTEWTVGGQKFTLDSQVSLDPNIGVGDEVKVEANVFPNGSVVASKVQSSVTGEAISKFHIEDTRTSSPDKISAPEAFQATKREIFGVIQALTADTVTVEGVAYNLADFTEFKDTLTVGDQVKLHVLVNADGTFIVREAEKSVTSAEDTLTSNHGSDESGNHDANDDNSYHPSSDDGSNHDSNDDHGGGDGNSGSGGG